MRSPVCHLFTSGDVSNSANTDRVVQPLADPSVDLIIIVMNILIRHLIRQTEHQTAVVHGGKRRMKNSKSSPTRSSVKGASIRSDDGDVPETMVEVRIR